MKKMLLAGLVFLVAQASMALGLPKEKLEARIKPYAERIEKAKLDKAGNFKADEKVQKLISDSLNKIVESAGAGDTAAFMKLLNADSSRAVITEIGRLSSVIGDKEATTSDKEAAKKALDLLAKASGSVKELSKNEAEAQEQQKKIDLAVKVSERIAKFNDFKSDAAKKYAQAYELALDNNKSPSEAMKEANKASKKEITEDDILNCVI